MFFKWNKKLFFSFRFTKCSSDLPSFYFFHHLFPSAKFVGSTIWFPFYQQYFTLTHFMSTHITSKQSKIRLIKDVNNLAFCFPFLNTDLRTINQNWLKWSIFQIYCVNWIFVKQNAIKNTFYRVLEDLGMLLFLYKINYHE